MAKEAETKELVAQNEWAVMNMDSKNLASIIEVNLAGEQLRVFDLDRIVVPSGGSTTWTVYDLMAGELETKEIEGIIIHIQPTRAMWEAVYGEGGGDSPPDCASLDGEVGMGIPGGNCAQCPFNQFENGKKKCKERRWIFLLQPNDLLPIVVDSPPSSLNEVVKYKVALTRAGKGLPNVVSRMTLKQTKNKDGIKYSKIIFSCAMIDPPAELLAQVDAYRQAIMPYLKSNE